MAVTIDGDGTITGVSVGGLPDGIVDTDMLASSAVTTAKINDDAVTDAKQSLSGAAKAWVKFDGTGTVGIEDSFNVSSITDHGTGRYSANFTNAMANADYAVAGMATDSGSASVVALSFESATTSAIRVQCIRTSTGFSDQGIVNVVVFGD